ncbi:hypothetical protein ANANG_G00134240 [Anguilla anguilla]|uniref:Uncharacterized protein n=1 Tax=Anguilla anguilla TaxID=7936 RepID=A0A9D3M9N0_ANGAN|nr:hypothetical protein ANANG_G00134240 [Anguilla anguilla]
MGPQQNTVQRTRKSVRLRRRTGRTGRRGKLGPRPSPGGARGASSSRAPAADQRAPAPAPKPAASSKDGRVSGGMSVSRARHTAAAAAAAGSQKARLTERPSVAPGAKPTLGPGVALPRSAGVSRLPVKAQDHGEPGPATGGTQASVPANGGKAGPGPPAPRHAGKPPITKTTGGVRVVVQSPQRKALAAGVKNAAVPSQTPSKSAASPLHRAGSGRFQRPATAPPAVQSAQKRPLSTAAACRSDRGPSVTDLSGTAAAAIPPDCSRSPERRCAEQLLGLSLV